MIAIHRHFVMLSNIKISASHFLEFLALGASLIASEFEWHHLRLFESYTQLGMCKSPVLH